MSQLFKGEKISVRIFKGEKISVQSWCGPLRDDESRRMFDIYLNENHSDFLTVSKKQAEELIIVLQAAILDWRGEL